MPALVPSDYPIELVDKDAVKLMFKAGSNIIDPKRIPKFVQVLQARYESYQGNSYGADETVIKPCETLDDLPLKKEKMIKRSRTLFQMEIDQIHNETATLKLITNEWKNKEKRLNISNSSAYENLPHVEDHSLAVLEKTVAGYAE